MTSSESTTALSDKLLQPEPLTAEAFAPYGDVIETADRDYFLINQDYTRRYHRLADVDTDKDGSAIISIFRAQVYPRPLQINMMEKHPLGSQAFIPLNQQAFLVVVAPPGDTVAPHDLKAFITNGLQGVNYHKGTWHYPVIALNNDDEFLVVDRSGSGNNCIEVFFNSDQSPVLQT
ncbi:ureidoglycolate lyase [Neptunomonas phycophila]|uniref:ureidoglycolate lyase n=1 Tax=Neptunomonas phycophila TaxID=1572645 RepID=UPI003735F3F2